MQVHEIERKQSRRVVLTIFSLLTVVVVASSVYYYNNLRNDLLRQGSVEVRVTAEQKAKLLKGWIDERKAEGNYLAKNPGLLESITTTGVKLNAREKASVTGIFEELRRNHDYTTIALLSNSGEHLILTGAEVPAGKGKRFAELVNNSDAPSVILDELAAEESIEIITPFPLNSGIKWGFIYQKIDVHNSLAEILREGESPLSDGVTRLFYYNSDTLYSILDTISPYSVTAERTTETIPQIIFTLAKRGASGVAEGAGFNHEEKISYFEKAGNYPVFIYYSHRLERVVEPLLTVGVLLTIIIFITIAAAGLAVSLTFSKQEAVFAGRMAESEAFLESIREGMSDGFILFSYDMRFKAVNSKTITIIRKSRDELIGQLATDVLPNLRNSGFWESFKRVSETRKPVTSIDYYPEWDTYFQNKMFPVKEGIALFFSDITEETKLKNELEAANDQLEALALHLQVATENEREAIAREIHDELGQVLTSMKMDLAIMKNALKAEGNGVDSAMLLADMNAMGGRIDATVKRLRRIITELRPEVLDHLGFVPAVEWLLDESASRSQIAFALEKNFESITLEKHASTALFRIIQEACTNIIRHSEATTATVSLTIDESGLRVTIKDNGRGFSTENSKNTRSFGLIGMKERAKLLKAVLQVESEEGKGTTISLLMKKKEGDQFA